MAVIRIWNGAIGVPAINDIDWNNAYLTLADAAAVATTGDTLLGASDHLQDYLVATSITMPDDCVLNSVSRSTEVYTKGFTEQTGTSSYTFIGRAHVEGCILKCSDFYSDLTHVHCDIILAGGQGRFGRTPVFDRCYINVIGSSVLFYFDGSYKFLRTVVVANVVSYEALLAATGAHIVIIENCDFSGVAFGSKSLYTDYGKSGSQGVLINNLTPSGVPIIYSGRATYGNTHTAIGCGAANEYYRFNVLSRYGETTENTLAYLHAKYDATNKYSALMNSSTNAGLSGALQYKLLEMAEQNLSLTDTTYRVNLLLDTDTVATLTDANFWIELSHNDNVSLALGKVVSSRNTDILATGTELALSAETWLGTLPLNTKAYQVDITLSAAQLTNVTNGNVVVYANLAVPNADVYICPAVMIGT